MEKQTTGGANIGLDENEQAAQRRQHLTAIEAASGPAYPNQFRVSIRASELLSRCHGLSAQTLAAIGRFSLAGRLVAVRSFGKSTFAHLQDRSGRIQIYFKKDRLADRYELLKHIDIGDIVGIEGHPFVTRTGELTVEVEQVQLLTKCLQPLPEKWHGLTDKELRYRQRYLDLIVNPDVVSVFKLRSQIIERIRQFLLARDYLEVETPMMHALAGGATARPFVTQHHALGIDLYLRIAPELYLKRLVVGGIERVFEINRCFRNEGISTIHNPEFTLLEFYQAYATYEDLMILTEELIRDVTTTVLGEPILQIGEQTIDLRRPWRRLTLSEALVTLGGIPEDELSKVEALGQRLARLGVVPSGVVTIGTLQFELFEQLVEHRLIEPTFITRFPVDVSPLARRSDGDPRWVDRFELFINGGEIANAFSELNDPRDQRSRFEAQLKQREAGNDEAMRLDDDYIRALEFGLPPTAGEGIGIDRLVMLLTGQSSIRDVIFFPLLKP